MGKPGQTAVTRKNRAFELYRVGRLTEARQLLSKVCARQKNDTEAWLTLALINRKTGLYADSERCCRHILEHQPRLANALLYLGAALQCQGRNDEAIQAYEQSIEAESNNPEAFYFLGNILREYKNINEAIAPYKRAVTLHPDYLEALGNLGATLMACGDTVEALEYLERAHQLMPQNVLILCNLAEANLFENRLATALDFVNRALTQDWSCVNAHLIKGKILQPSGNFDGALNCYKRALEIDPENVEAAAGGAVILEMRSAFAEAATFLEPLIIKGIDNTVLLLGYASLAPHINKAGDAIRLLERKLKVRDLTSPEKINLHFRLGKLLDRERRYDPAFESYQKANDLSLTLSTEPPRRHSFENLLPAMLEWASKISTYAREQLPEAVNDTRHIFIVGMPRSGTTLVEQILASHPQVHGAGELHDIHRHADSLASQLGTDENYPKNLGRISSEILTEIANIYSGKLSSLNPDATLFVDKLPFNFLHLPFIRMLFPNSLVIHTRRDPLDTCLSIYFQAFSTDMPAAKRLQTIGEYYGRYRELMHIWKHTFGIPMLEVHYEKIVEDPKRAIGEILQFCELDWNDKCLSFHQTARDVNTPSYDQVRQPLYTTSINRWKHYEKYLLCLKEILAHPL